MISSLDLYSQMATIRAAELEVLELRKADEIAGSVHVCVGQESVPAAILAASIPADRILATYRGHGWALARGVPLDAFFGELLGRETGTNGGRGGSPYFTSPDHGFVGENSIVGAGLPIANGVAMGLLAAGEGGVVVVSFGDGATNQGAVHEALVFAHARRLPVLFVCENNDWSEMTPIVDTLPGVSIAGRARAAGLTSFEADGSDVPNLATLAARIFEGIRRGDGPAFLEVKVPRILGHYNGDLELYRTEDDRNAHLARDPLARLRESLVTSGQSNEAELSEMDRASAQRVADAIESARSAARPDPASAREHVVGSAVPNIASPIPSSGKELAYGLAINRALTLELTEREDVITFGEDIAIPGGTFGVTRNLRKQFGERVFDTPISESAILGAAIGASLSGLRPVVEIMWTDFLLVALDQLVNQAANVRYISRGKVSAPLVVRMQQGITPGSCAQHSQSLEALLAHIPGLKVGLPSGAADAFSMTRAAIADPDPVVLIESRALYLSKGYVDVEAPVEGVGGARLVIEGEDITIVSWGRSVHLAVEASQTLRTMGIGAEVIDLRWLNPLDYESVSRSVRKTGRALIVHEANFTGGFGGEISARIVDLDFKALRAPVGRIGLPDVRVPSAPNLQEALVPSVSDVVREARRIVDFD